MTDAARWKLSRPLLLYDGDCRFCCKWVRRWEEMGEGSVEFAPSQSGAGAPFGFSATEPLKAVQLIGTNGMVRSGAAAVFELMALCGGHVAGASWWLYQNVASIRVVTEWVYRLVAEHRPVFSLLTRLLWGEDARKPSYEKASQIFLQLLAVTYLAAFAGFWWQANGLVGPAGILPAGEFLDHAHAVLGGDAYHELPTLFWLTGCSTVAISVVCGAGTIFSLGAILLPRLRQGPLFLILEILYLSLVNVGQIFMGYQWDALLLEAGFLAIFLAPWPGRFRWANFLSSVSRWMLVWLLFRLMLSSALVKWFSGDPAWRDLSALQYHFWTQPLPNPGGWLAGQLPDGVLRCMTLAMFLIEGGAPWLLFGPRNLRLLGAALIAFLQILIALTGNYGFFNLLALALCVLVVDDGSWPKPIARLRQEARDRNLGCAPASGALSPGRALILLCAGVLFLISFVPMPMVPKPPLLVSAYEILDPLHLVNGYGLFAVMTKQRSEIIVEGSLDGMDWKPYVFRFKPGNLHKPPTLAPFLMPRLDWQMWFAALGPVQESPWFGNFLVRLFQANPSVLALLAEDPFHGHAPRFLRALLEEYRFSTPRELRKDGLWWVSRPAGSYLPAVESSGSEDPGNRL